MVLTTSEIMPRIHNRTPLRSRRKQLRSSLTPAGVVLWRNLQQSQSGGKEFRRQHSVGSYVLDFYCTESRLAVELDVQGHLDSIASERDLRRTAYIASLNIRVLRFENRAVFENLRAVLYRIKQHLGGPSREKNRVGTRSASPPQMLNLQSHLSSDEEGLRGRAHRERPPRPSATPPEPGGEFWGLEAGIKRNLGLNQEENVRIRQAPIGMSGSHSASSESRARCCCL